MDKALNLLQRDIVRLRRENTLLFLIGYPIFSAIIARIVVPFIPVEHLALYVAPPLVMFAGLAIGMAFGFNLIEEKEEKTWLVLRVVPLRTSTYFLYLVVATAVPSLLLSFATALIYGLPVANLGQFFLMALSTSFTGPLWALLLGILANNKVEGLALTKTLSFMTLAPVMAFVSSPVVQLSVAWNPWYWSYIGLLQAYATPGVIEDLAVNMPAYPGFLFWLVPMVLSLLGVARLAGTWRKRVE